MTIAVTSLPLNNNATKLGLVGLLTGSDSAATPITRNLSLIAEAPGQRNATRSAAASARCGTSSP